MLVIKPYRRENAVEYARKYAFGQNKYFASFKGIGGNCTNFVSQCIYAGGCQMNYTPTFGWYYISLDQRAPAWTGVEFFYNFLTQNNLSSIGNGAGPFAEEVDISRLEIGDFVQLGRSTGDFYHTPVVVGFREGVPLVAAHTYDAYARPLDTYSFEKIRCLHILGARVE